MVSDAIRRLMWCFFAVSCWIATTAQAFAPTPIRWGGLSARNFVIGPAGFANIRLPSPQNLAIWDAATRMPSETIPFFIAQPDKSILYHQNTRGASWCVEADGDTVRVNYCNGMPKQKWNLLSRGHGQSQIQLQGSAKCLEVSGTSDFNGAPINLEECHGKTSELWMFEDPLLLPRESLPSLHHTPFSSTPHAMISCISLAILGALGLSVRLWRQSKARAMVVRQLDAHLPCSFEQCGLLMTAPSASHLGNVPLASSSDGVAQKCFPAVMSVSPGDDAGMSSIFDLIEANVEKDIAQTKNKKKKNKEKAMNVATLDSSPDGQNNEEQTLQVKLNKQIMSIRDGDKILRLVEREKESLDEVNLATALHRLAIFNKKNRRAQLRDPRPWERFSRNGVTSPHLTSGRDMLSRDPRFGLLSDAVMEQSSRFSARGLSDILMSYAQLQDIPPTLLAPLLTGVAKKLEAKEFDGKGLAKIVSSLAKLGVKPVKLLQEMEEQVVSCFSEMRSQSYADLISGFVTLEYKPTKMMPKFVESILAEGVLDEVKPFDVAKIVSAIGQLDSKPGEYNEILLALSARAKRDTALPLFNSRHLCILVEGFTQMEATSILPPGLLDEWILAIRVAHAARPLLANDQKRLMKSLTSLGMDSSWIQKREILNEWLLQALGRTNNTPGSEYTDEVLQDVFDSIDTDKSGNLDTDEIKVALKAINLGTDDETISNMVKLADSDGDVEVSFSEFKELMLKRISQGGGTVSLTTLSDEELTNKLEQLSMEVWLLEKEKIGLGQYTPSAEQNSAMVQTYRQSKQEMERRGLPVTTPSQVLKSTGASKRDISWLEKIEKELFI